MFLGVPETHGSWMPKFPTHESAHGLSRGTLRLRLNQPVVPNVRGSPVW